MPPQLSSTLCRQIETLAYLAPGELAVDTPLFSSGIIDSLNLLQLVTFVEQQCGFKVAAEELTLEHWDSVERILAYIGRRSS